MLELGFTTEFVEANVSKDQEMFAVVAHVQIPRNVNWERTCAMFDGHYVWKKVVQADVLTSAEIKKQYY
jgi:hypothetical protein